MNKVAEEKLNKAIELHESGKYNEAKVLYKEILRGNPDNDIVLGGLGLICIEKNDLDRAAVYIQKALEISKNDIYYNSLGDIYYKKKDYPRARECFLEVLKSYPDNMMAIFNMGAAYLSEFRIDEAMEYLERALQMNPENHECNFHLGYAYSEKLQMDKAVHYLAKAIKLKKTYVPAIFHLSNVLLKSGNFIEGWKLYESRLCVETAKKEKIKSSKPLWDGSSLEGKTIYVQHEQGYGDGIMCARFISTLNSMGAKVLFKPHRGLEQLFKDSELPAEIIDNSIPVNTLEFDTCQLMMSLPLLLKIDSTNVPSRDKYLKANPEKLKSYKEKYFNNNEFKIGIVWQCKNLYPRDMVRSIPDISYLFPITKIPGVKVYSLQKGEGKAQLEQLPDDVEIIDIGNTFKDFSDTAAAIENLDLVISVDTSVPHLSAAMGKETLLLLEYSADWKWFMNRDDSLWYEKMKLFRQNKPNNWLNVVDQVVEYVKHR